MSEETGLVRLSQDCALTCHSPGLPKGSSRGHRHNVGEDPDCPNNPGLMDGTNLYGHRFKYEIDSPRSTSIVECRLSDRVFGIHCDSHWL